jgi:hypothetical protein
MAWINDPELTSEQKEKIYYESMEKAMDAGGRLALSEIPMFQSNLALKHVKAESKEAAQAFREALELSFFHFKVQEGVEDDSAWNTREELAEELIEIMTRAVDSVKKVD